MPSYEYKIDDRSRIGSRFISSVKEQLQHALWTEKASRKITQQSIADKLGVNRSVINRQFMGLENMTIRSIAELLWALGWEPHFEARKENLVGNEFVQEPLVTRPSNDEVAKKPNLLLVTTLS